MGQKSRTPAPKFWKKSQIKIFFCEKKSWIATTSSLYLCALCVHIMQENIKFLKYKKNPIDRSIQRIFWTKTYVRAPFAHFLKKVHILDKTEPHP